MSNRIHTTLAAATLLLAGSSVAHASPDFTGPYLGVHGGWSVIDTEASGPAGSDDGLAASGAMVNAVAGTSFMTGNYMLAVEAHVGSSDADFSSSNGSDMTVEGGLTWGLTGRLGRHIADNTLLYGLLGWQSTDVEMTMVNGGRSSDDKAMGGPRIGAGFELINEARMFLRFEYSVTAHRSRSFDMDGVDIDLDPTAHQFLIGGGYRF